MQNKIQFNLLSMIITFSLFVLVGNATAADKVVVVPLGSSPVGNALAADVVKGKTFASKAAGKGATGTLVRHPMGNVYSNTAYGLTFNLIPAGSFTMGSPANEPGHDSDEEPQVQTTISQPFYMMVHEVPQYQWGVVVFSGVLAGHLAPGALNADPSFYKNPTFPVTNVSYNDVTLWTTTLNKLDGRLNCTGNLHENCYRLPTEAEWEYAARAGTTTAYANQYNFDSTQTETGVGFNANLNTMGWYAWNNTNSNYAAGIKPTMMKQANGWGLYDMHGNVYEWCRDWYDSTYYGYTPPQRPAKDPEGPSTGSDRVLRGGSWDYSARYTRSAYRSSYTPGNRFNYLGFRLVLSPGQ